MSRLWPERLIAAVFPESSWLRRAGGRQLGEFTDAPSPKPDVIGGLERLLQDRIWTRKPSVELLVSDCHARVVHLPWQDSLTNDEQTRAYARACLDQAGLGVDDSWLVQAAFRHYRGAGLAYALPRSLVAEVKAHLDDRGLRLRAVLPVSCAAYWRNRTGALRQRSMLVLEEHRRVSALLFDGLKCSGIHVQPAASAPGKALQRLIGGVKATFPDVQRVQYWSVRKEAAVDSDTITALLQHARVERLPRDCWD